MTYGISRVFRDVRSIRMRCVLTSRSLFYGARMIERRWVWVSLVACLFVSVIAACGNKDASEKAEKKAPVADVKNAPYRVDSFCPEICQRTRELQCRAAARCDAMCRAAFADMACPTALRTAMDCALAQPLTSWTCSQDGIGAVSDGPCDGAQAAYDACLTALPK